MKIHKRYSPVAIAQTITAMEKNGLNRFEIHVETGMSASSISQHISMLKDLPKCLSLLLEKNPFTAPLTLIYLKKAFKTDELKTKLACESFIENGVTRVTAKEFLDSLSCNKEISTDFFVSPKRTIDTDFADDKVSSKAVFNIAERKSGKKIAATGVQIAVSRIKNGKKEHAFLSLDFITYEATGVWVYVNDETCEWSTADNIKIESVHQINFL